MIDVYTCTQHMQEQLLAFLDMVMYERSIYDIKRRRPTVASVVAKKKSLSSSFLL